MTLLKKKILIINAKLDSNQVESQKIQKKNLLSMGKLLVRVYLHRKFRKLYRYSYIFLSRGTIIFLLHAFFFKSNLSNIIFKLVKLKIKLYTLYFLRLILLRYSELRKSQISLMHLHKCIFICSQFPFDTLQRTIMLTFFSVLQSDLEIVL